MRLNFTIDGNETIAKLGDKLTFEDHAQFRSFLDEVNESGSKRCILDLGDLSAIDSAGLGMLMVAHEASEQNNWELVLRGPTGQVKRMLEITEFGTVLSIHE